MKNIILNLIEELKKLDKEYYIITCKNIHL